MNKFVCDLKKFREAISTVGSTNAGDGQHFCAWGKLGFACGGNPLDKDQFSSVCWQVHGIFGYSKMADIILTNNKKSFDKADAMLLQMAIESGRFEFINGLPEEVLEKELEYVNP